MAGQSPGCIVCCTAVLCAVFCRASGHHCHYFILLGSIHCCDYAVLLHSVHYCLYAVLPHLHWPYAVLLCALLTICRIATLRALFTVCCTAELCAFISYMLYVLTLCTMCLYCIAALCCLYAVFLRSVHYRLSEESCGYRLSRGISSSRTFICEFIVLTSFRWTIPAYILQLFFPTRVKRVCSRQMTSVAMPAEAQGLYLY